MGRETETGGTMNIRVRGRFSSVMAMDLSAFMKNTYPGQGYIIIDTEEIEVIEIKAAQLFVKCQDVLGLPVEKIFYTGRSALQISCREEAVMHKPLPGGDGEIVSGNSKISLDVRGMIH